MMKLKILCRRILSLATLILGVAIMIEAFGTWQLVSGKTTPVESAIFFGAHTTAVVLFAFAFPRLLPSTCRSSSLSSALLFFAMTFFVPLLGMLGTLIIFLSLPRRNNTFFGQSLAVARHCVPTLPKLPRALEYMTNPLDRDAIEGILVHSKDTSARLCAILLTLKLKEKDAVSLLQMSLKDPVDDLRLLAYSLLNRKEKTIYDRIDSITVRLRELGSSKATHMLYQSLVCAYFELVYSGLADGQSASFLLGKAREMAVEGLKHHSNSAGLYFQLGRILLLRQEYKEAVVAFQQAKALGTDEQKILPYLVEAAYCERDFYGAKCLLGKIRNGQHTLFPSVADYWKAEVL